MTVVLRVEDINGKGPFIKDLIHRAEYLGNIEYYLSCYRHPDPVSDGITSFPGHYVFGFEDMSQFLDWFDHAPTRYHLNNLGAYLCTYEVYPTLVIKGERQLVFDPTSATLINRSPLP